MVLYTGPILSQNYETVNQNPVVRPNQWNLQNRYEQPAVPPYSLPVVALKTNLLTDAALLSPNLKLEFGLSKRTSLELSYIIRPWRNKEKDNDKKLLYWFASPEFRYWTCERFNGHFFGIHPFFGEYNVSGYKIPQVFEKDFRYEGTAMGAGISYGYHLILNHRWSLEATVGVGYAYLKYDKFECGKCGNKINNFTKSYFGPTRVAINLIYIIK